MAPLCDALLNPTTVSKQEGKTVYHGTFDKTWVIGSIPQGGYSLGLLLQACIDHQAGTRHPDAVHLTGHFLQATSAAEPYDVHVRVIKTGRGFSNLGAELVQRGNVKISAHAIFGDLSPASADGAPGTRRLALAPPSPYARRLPLTRHPSAHAFDAMRRPWSFREYVGWSLDRTIMARNERPAGSGGVEWAAWCELTHPADRVVTSAMPFFGDMFENLPGLLPKSEPAAQDQMSNWYPTMVMTVEFKAHLPSAAPSSPTHSHRTVGLYCESRFLGDPQGRHNARVEVWTAPSEIGGSGGVEGEGWRDGQFCVAVVEQMCLTIPFAVNQREGTRERGKL